MAERNSSIASFQRIGQVRAKLKQIADEDVAETPEPASGLRPDRTEKTTGGMLANKRVLNRSIGMFLTARTKSEAGAFDRIDLGESDRIDVAERHDTPEPPEGPAPSSADSAEDRPPIETPVRNANETMTYGDMQISRNEPISDLSVVRCQWSVARCPSHGPPVVR